MQIKHLLFMVYSVMGISHLHAQSQIAVQPTASVAFSEIRELKVGDHVPDLVFENILNYKNKKEKLSAHKGKLVILDMWSTTCSSCIAGFPKMEKLQKEFGGQIQILLVDPYAGKYDSEEMVKLTLEKNQQRTGFYPSLPIPVNDTILNSYFPRESVPHHVWIDGEGKVIGITTALSTTAENIRTYLEGKALNMPVKNDWAFDPAKPLLIDGNGGDPNDYKFRTLFTGYNREIQNAPGFVRMNANNEVIGAYMINIRLRQLVQTAYPEMLRKARLNRVILNVKNPAQFKPEYDTANAWCYDITIPPVKRELFWIAKYLKADLDRYFNITAYQEKRTIPCLVITPTNKVDRSATKYDKPAHDLDKNSIKKYIHGYSLKEILDAIGLDRYEKPFIDETGLSTLIDIDFPDNASLTDVTTVITAFKKAGFIIREENRELEMIVITDK